jgi:DNA polymerase-4
VSARLKAERLAGRVVVLKLKSGDFQLRTRHAKLAAPTNLADRIFRTGRELLLKELDGTRFRLLGIGMADLCDETLDPAVDLVDPDAGKRARAEAAMDDIRARYGADGLALGLTFSVTAAPKGDLR